VALSFDDDLLFGGQNRAKFFPMHLKVPPAARQKCAVRDAVRDIGKRGKIGTLS